LRVGTTCLLYGAWVTLDGELPVQVFVFGRVQILHLDPLFDLFVLSLVLLLVTLGHPIIIVTRFN